MTGRVKCFKEKNKCKVWGGIKHCGSMANQICHGSTMGEIK